MLKKETVLAYFFFTIMGTWGVILTFTSFPDVYFCANANPCTCAGGPFRAYRSSCTFINAPLDEQTAFFNGSKALPNLPQEFMQMDLNKTSNVTSYSLNLKKMEEQFPPLFSAVTEKVQSSVEVGAITISLIVFFMLATNQLASWLQVNIRRVERVFRASLFSISIRRVATTDNEK